MRINPKTTALLVIDMQNDFVREGAIMEVPYTRKQIPAIKAVIDAAREKAMPVIYTVHVTDPVLNPLEIESFPHLAEAGMRKGTLGVQVVDELAPKSVEYVLEKTRYSAFYGTDLEAHLKNQGIDTVIVTGTLSNICCESTARDAYFRDIRVIFGSDLNSALTKEVQQATLANMEIFGTVADAQTIIQAIN
jgi:ureidoacrylate peracid hydrolase